MVLWTGSNCDGAEEPAIGLWAQIREDWEVNGRDWTRPGFRALAVHRVGVWRMRIKSAMIRKPLSFLYTMLYRFVRNHYSIELDYTVKVGRRVMIGHQGAIVFHENAVIGDDCIIRQGVTIGAASQRHSHEAPRLGRGVHIGAGAMVLGNITIGDHAAIGANAVITTDLPSYAVATVAPPQVALHPERAAEDASIPNQRLPASSNRLTMAESSVSN